MAIIGIGVQMKEEVTLKVLHICWRRKVLWVTGHPLENGMTTLEKSMSSLKRAEGAEVTAHHQLPCNTKGLEEQSRNQCKVQVWG
ncbi:hypothetical protein Y1Q_0004370 [Alligator mississippiensis]|uniref:Uncharacterized protein n=1 Tax=Alligator mississippiensis TaxID=8496 RepID=A0A151MIJ7_ALLMI|nr:hypothetical protein Y1Q_0004370 [Alligator mississippiensis]